MLTDPPGAFRCRRRIREVGANSSQASDQGARAMAKKEASPHFSATRNVGSEPLGGGGLPVTVCLAYLGPQAAASAQPAGRVHSALPTDEKRRSRPPARCGCTRSSDGFRVIARKDGARVRLYSRPGNDLTDRFSLIVEALAGLRSRSCIIDGEAVAV